MNYADIDTSWYLAHATRCAFVSAFVVASPGPTALLIVQAGKSTGVRSALRHVAAVLLGDLVFLALAFGGVASLIAVYAEAWAAVRLLAGAYLLHIAWAISRALRKNASLALPVTQSVAVGTVAGTFFSHLLNPKAVILFSTLIVSLLPAGRAGDTSLMCLIGLTHLAVAFIVLTAYAWLGRMLAAVPASWARGVDFSTAACLFYLGAHIVVTDAVSVL
jgi:homoserine/homoserine lactone efflux protein